MMQDWQRTIDKMSGSMRRASGVFLRTVGRMVPQQPRYALSPLDQLKVFLQHTPSSLRYVRQKYGEAAFQQYLADMAELMERFMTHGSN